MNVQGGDGSSTVHVISHYHSVLPAHVITTRSLYKHIETKFEV